jgi:exodeoxyribonuclease VII large subunit
MRLALRARLARDAARQDKARSALLRASPLLRLAALRLRLEGSRQRLAAAARDHVGSSRRRLELAMRTLDAVSPLATLGRGYAIVTDSAGRVLRDAAKVQAGQRVAARLARGAFTAEVIGQRPDSRAPDDES